MNKLVNSSAKNPQFFQADIEHFINKFQTHDAVIITALRDDGYQHKQKSLDNNKDLYSALFALHYPITELRNSYIKDFEKRLQIDDDNFHGSYLVVNRFDKSDFMDNLVKLAKFYEQDYLFVIRGGVNPTAFLFNVQQNQEIPYPECYDLMGNPQFFQSFRNQKFYFTGAINDKKVTNSEMVGVGFQPSNWLGRWACSSMGKRVLRQAGILVDN